MFDRITNGRASIRSTLLIAALCFLVSHGVLAQSSEEKATLDTHANEQAPSTTAEKKIKLDGDHLVVPVFPRYQPKADSEDISSLKDSYIVLEDGSVLSVADWLLGSLNKSNIRAGMSDYENRLFLGQVARAAAGLDEQMVLRSVRDVGQLRSFTPKEDRTPAVIQTLKGLLVLAIIPGLDPNWSPDLRNVTPSVASLRDVDRGSGGALLFDKQFDEAFQHTFGDTIYNGRLISTIENAGYSFDAERLSGTTGSKAAEQTSDQN